jgi:hypothetical protein
MQLGWRVVRGSFNPPPPFFSPRAQVHYILDEIIMGGMVLETNIADILEGIIEMKKLEDSTRTANVKN